ncbi:MAG: glycosyltransferase family 4 protein [Alphaproteobacteria bacterium]|nr:glycosyltransferase family 4 protein [Alphaproteobacteria bacterium]
MAALRVLTFTTLFPNSQRPNHGVFVENRLRQTASRHGLQATVLAPVPFFPFRSATFGAYAAFARVPRREERHGFTVHHPRYLVIPKVGMTAAAWLLYRGALAACKRLGLDRTTIDVIDAHYFYPDGVAAAWLARALNLPFVVTARGTDLNVLPQYQGVRRQILWAASQASAVITVSEALRQQYLTLGAEGRKAAVLRNGVDLTAFKPVEREAARKLYGVTGFTIVSVGNLVPLKGHALTIEAMASLPDCQLLIAGGGPLRASLQETARAMGVSERVRLLGEVPHAELPRLFSAADVSVLMSEREGWANVLLESMACGTPVLATRVGGNAEAITAVAAGGLLKDRSVAALVAAVRDFRARGGDRAATRRHAEAFGWSAVAAGNHALLAAAADGTCSERPAQEIVDRAMHTID